ncbi:UvrD-helicase domain-containing protein [Kitasatospora aburaviensis]|uniref:UvrD-helicase domain-containing protein n=1 Tax=Kitasatospora aburaviensis TaxID=67265 RepID=A0ABW1EYR3_9ACTN
MPHENRTAAAHLEVKVTRRPWNPALHPRDSRGRFVETGGIARLWGGGLGRVLRALAGDKVLVERLDTGAQEKLFANRLTMVARPDGSAPTANQDKVQAEDAKREAQAASGGRGDGITKPDAGDPRVPTRPHAKDDDGQAIPDDRPTVSGVLESWRRGEVRPLAADPEKPQDARLRREAARERADAIASPQLTASGRHLIGQRDGEWRVYEAATGRVHEGQHDSKRDALSEADALETGPIHKQGGWQSYTPEELSAAAEKAGAPAGPAEEQPGYRWSQASLIERGDFVVAGNPRADGGWYTRRVLDVERDGGYTTLTWEGHGGRKETLKVADGGAADGFHLVSHPYPYERWEKDHNGDAPSARIEAEAREKAAGRTPRPEDRDGLETPHRDAGSTDGADHALGQDGGDDAEQASDTPDGTGWLAPGSAASRRFSSVQEVRYHWDDGADASTVDSARAEKDRRVAFQVAQRTQSEQLSSGGRFLVAKTPKGLWMVHHAGTGVVVPSSYKTSWPAQNAYKTKREAMRAANAAEQVRDEQGRLFDWDAPNLRDRVTDPGFIAAFDRAITGAGSLENGGGRDQAADDRGGDRDGVVRQVGSAVREDVPAGGDGVAGERGGAGSALREGGSAGGGSDREADGGVAGAESAGGRRSSGAGAGEESGAVAGSGAGAERRGVPAEGTGDGGSGAAARRGVAAGRFRARSQEDLAPAGERAKLRANVEALRTLRRIQVDDRSATGAEKRVLARWSGWGSLPTVLSDEPRRGNYKSDEAFERAVERWKSFAGERAELRTLLDDGEWAAAQKNVLNAHYTDQSLVDAVWQAMEALGFDGGNVLEPGSGSGNFIGAAPAGTHMTGVELDPTTAAIARAIYPDAQILTESFAKTRAPRGGFDGVVGNVPFGDIKLTDPVHNKGRKLSIHDHFIKKSLELTRPGGLVAVVSSRYTMDSKDPRARQEMAKLGDLVGAVRLPEGAHEKAAGTHVVTDVLVFRRRAEGEAPGDQSWVESTPVDVGGHQIEVNRYFQQHPDNVLGELTTGRGQFTDHDLTVRGDKDAAPALRGALARITAQAKAEGRGFAPHEAGPREQIVLQAAADRQHEGAINARPDGTFTQVVDGQVRRLDVHHSQVSQLRDLLELRNLTTALLDEESSHEGDDETERMATLRAELNRAYDAYTAAYAPLDKPGQNRIFTPDEARVRAKDGGLEKVPDEWKAPTALALFDDDFASAFAYGLDRWNDSTKTAAKAEILHQRVVAPRKIAERADSPDQAVSLALEHDGELRLSTLARLMGTSESDALEQLGTRVFRDPSSGRLLAAADYLSGDVRRKLAVARRHLAAGRGDMASHVAALEAVVPRDLVPGEISAKMGAPWIGEDDVTAFLREILETPHVRAEYGGGSMWVVDGPSQGIASRVTWGTKRRSASEIAEAVLQQKQITVTRKLPDGKSVVDDEGTADARDKATAMAERFAAWVWEDEARAARLAKVYNDRFNGIALRDYSDVQLTLPGITAGWNMRPHQNAAIARILNEPSALLAHEVGAGKTATMVAATQELRRTGLAKKPAVVVPNHMLAQFRREYLELYPNAKVLAASSADLTGKKRRKFIARAATGDWDAVILTHSAFGKIPMTPANRRAYMEEELARLRRQIADAKARDGQSLTLKQLENALTNAEEAMEKRLEQESKDTGAVYWEQTGVDYLMVDEAHEFKNLRTVSSIPGAAVTGSAKASDLHMKVEYLRGKSESGRVLTFATGTPIANSVTEAYTMKRYLRPDLLDAAGINDFDAWAATFGDVVTDVEVKPDGSGFQEKARFAQFRNVPELLRMYRVAADVQTAADLNLPTPRVRRNEEGKRGELRVVPISAEQKAYIEDLPNHPDAKEPGGILKIIGLGKRAAIDPRLVGGSGEEGGKIDHAAREIASIYRENKDVEFPTSKNDPTPQPLKGALQLVFMDQGVPGSKAKGGLDEYGNEQPAWNAYEYMRERLVESGVPREQIRFIHEAGSDKAKAKLFEDARNGKIAVLIGSTTKMGTGTNIQDRAVALHHMDYPWRPADMAQREGRVERQGNLHYLMDDDVRIISWITEETFDAFNAGTLERKAKFIAQMNRRNFDLREMEDIGDTAVSFAVMKALATGNTTVLDHAKAVKARVDLQRADVRWHRQQDEKRRAADVVTQHIAWLDDALESWHNARAQRVETRGDSFGMTIPGRERFTSRKQAAGPLLALVRAAIENKGLTSGDRVELGQLGGHTAYATVDYDISGNRIVRVGFDWPLLRGRRLSTTPGTYSHDDLDDGAGTGIIASLEKRLDGLDDLIEEGGRQLAESEDELVRARRGLGGQPPYGEALKSAERRVALLAQLITAEQKKKELRGRGGQDKELVKATKRVEDLESRLEAERPDQDVIDKAVDPDPDIELDSPDPTPVVSTDRSGRAKVNVPGQRRNPDGAATEREQQAAPTKAAEPEAAPSTPDAPQASADARLHPSTLTDEQIADEIAALEPDLLGDGEVSGEDVARHALLASEQAARAEKAREAAKKGPGGTWEEMQAEQADGEDAGLFGAADVLAAQPTQQAGDEFGTPDMFADAEGATDRLKAANLRRGDRYVADDGTVAEVADKPELIGRSGKGGVRVRTTDGRTLMHRPNHTFRRADDTTPSGRRPDQDDQQTASSPKPNTEPPTPSAVTREPSAQSGDAPDQQAAPAAGAEESQEQPYENGAELVTPDGAGHFIGATEGQALVNVDGTYVMHPLRDVHRPGDKPTAEALEDAAAANEARRAKLAQAATPEGIVLDHGARLHSLDEEAGHGWIADEDGNTIGWIRSRPDEKGRTAWWGQDGRGGAPEDMTWHNKMPAKAGIPPIRVATHVAQGIDLGHRGEKTGPSQPGNARQEVKFTEAQVRELAQLAQPDPDEPIVWKPGVFRRYTMRSKQMRTLRDTARAAAEQADTSTAVGRRRQKTLRNAADKLDREAYETDRTQATLPRPGEPDPFAEPYKPAGQPALSPEGATSNLEAAVSGPGELTGPRPAPAVPREDDSRTTDDRGLVSSRPVTDMSHEELGQEHDDLGEAIERVKGSGDPLDLAWRRRAELRQWEVAKELNRKTEADEPKDRGEEIQNRLDGHGLRADEDEGRNVERIEDMPPAKPSAPSDEEWERINTAATEAEEYSPTTEQALIHEAVARRGLNTAVMALAGTGKSSTLKQLSRRMPGKKIDYLAFNRSVAEEAKQAKAKGEYADNVTPQTANGMAFRAVNQRYRDAGRDLGKRLPQDGEGGAKRQTAQTVADLMRVYDWVEYAPGQSLKPSSAAYQARDLISRWSQSADEEMGPQHLSLPPWIEEEHRGALFEALKPIADRMWADILDPNGKLTYDQDYIVKQWALSGFKVDSDVIFFDEAQDVNPVLDGVVRAAMKQGVQVVAVGDSNQSIYGFRGATDALARFPVDARLTLTQSFRFGPEIAEIGNRFLRLSGTEMRLKGLDSKDSRIAELGPDEADAVLCRTNATAVIEAIDALDRGKRVAVAGGLEEIRKFVEAARQLQAGERTSHKDLADFAAWDDVVQYVEEESEAAGSMRTLVQLIENDSDGKLARLMESGGLAADIHITDDGERLWISGTKYGVPDHEDFTKWLKDAKANGFGKLAWDDQSKRWYYQPGTHTVRHKSGRVWTVKNPDGNRDTARAAIQEYIDRNSHAPNDGEGGIVAEHQDPDVVISTAHKSKGLEWRRVRIAGDFRGPEVNDSGRHELATMPSDEDLRLSYVAVTRATEALDAGSLGWVWDVTRSNDPMERPDTDYLRDWASEDFAKGDTVLYVSEDGEQLLTGEVDTVGNVLTVRDQETGRRSTISLQQVRRRNGEPQPRAVVASDEDLQKAIDSGRYSAPGSQGPGDVQLPAPTADAVADDEKVLSPDQAGAELQSIAPDAGPVMKPANAQDSAGTPPGAPGPGDSTSFPTRHDGVTLNRFQPEGDFYDLWRDGRLISRLASRNGRYFPYHPYGINGPKKRRGKKLPGDFATLDQAIDQAVKLDKLDGPPSVDAPDWHLRGLAEYLLNTLPPLGRLDDNEEARGLHAAATRALQALSEGRTDSGSVPQDLRTVRDADRELARLGGNPDSPFVKMDLGTVFDTLRPEDRPHRATGEPSPRDIEREQREFEARRSIAQARVEGQAGDDDLSADAGRENRPEGNRVVLSPDEVDADLRSITPTNTDASQPDGPAAADEQHVPTNTEADAGTESDTDLPDEAADRGPATTGEAAPLVVPGPKDASPHPAGHEGVTINRTHSKNDRYELWRDGHRIGKVSRRGKGGTWIAEYPFGIHGGMKTDSHHGKTSLYPTIEEAIDRVIAQYRPLQPDNPNYELWSLAHSLYMDLYQLNGLTEQGKRDKRVARLYYDLKTLLNWLGMGSPEAGSNPEAIRKARDLYRELARHHEGQPEHSMFMRGDVLGDVLDAFPAEERAYRRSGAPSPAEIEHEERETEWRRARIVAQVEGGPKPALYGPDRANDHGSPENDANRDTSSTQQAQPRGGDGEEDRNRSQEDDQARPVEKDSREHDRADKEHGVTEAEQELDRSAVERDGHDDEHRDSADGRQHEDDQNQDRERDAESSDEEERRRRRRRRRNRPNGADLDADLDGPDVPLIGAPLPEGMQVPRGRGADGGGTAGVPSLSGRGAASGAGTGKPVRRGGAVHPPHGVVASRWSPEEGGQVPNIAGRLASAAGGHPDAAKEWGELLGEAEAMDPLGQFDANVKHFLGEHDGPVREFLAERAGMLRADVEAVGRRALTDYLERLRTAVGPKAAEVAYYGSYRGDGRRGGPGIVGEGRYYDEVRDALAHNVVQARAEAERRGMDPDVAERFLKQADGVDPDGRSAVDDHSTADPVNVARHEAFVAMVAGLPDDVRQDRFPGTLEAHERRRTQLGAVRADQASEMAPSGALAAEALSASEHVARVRERFTSGEGIPGSAKNRAYVARIGANPTLGVSPGGGVAYWSKDGGRTWEFGHALTGATVGSRDASTVEGNREDAAAMAARYEQLVDEAGRPFPWDAPDAQRAGRGWRDAEGRKFGEAMRAVRDEHAAPRDVAGTPGDVPERSDPDVPTMDGTNQVLPDDLTGVDEGLLEAHLAVLSDQVAATGEWDSPELHRIADELDRRTAQRGDYWRALTPLAAQASDALPADEAEQAAEDELMDHLARLYPTKESRREQLERVEAERQRLRYQYDNEYKPTVKNAVEEYTKGYLVRRESAQKARAARAKQEAEDARAAAEGRAARRVATGTRIDDPDYILFEAPQSAFDKHASDELREWIEHHNGGERPVPFNRYYQEHLANERRARAQWEDEQDTARAAGLGEQVPESGTPNGEAVERLAGDALLSQSGGALLQEEPSIRLQAAELPDGERPESGQQAAGDRPTGAEEVGAPDPIGGQPAQWVGVDQLRQGDVARVEGTDGRGNPVARAGWVLGLHQEMVDRGGRFVRGYEVTIAEDIDGVTGRRGGVFVPADAQAARASKPDHPAGNGALLSGAQLEAMTGRLDGDHPTDRRGQGLFPGSLVRGPGGREGMVTGVTVSTASVRYDGRRHNQDAAPGDLEVTDGGAARPAGWTRDGQHIKPGQVAVDPDSRRPVGVVQSVEGDNVQVATPDGVLLTDGAALTVARGGQSAEAGPAIVELRPVAAGELADGDVVLVDDAGRKTPVRIVGQPDRSGDNVVVDYEEVETGAAGQLHADRSLLLPRATGADGRTADLAPQEAVTGIDDTRRITPVVADPEAGPVVTPQLTPAERARIHDLGLGDGDDPQAQQAAERIDAGLPVTVEQAQALEGVLRQHADPGVGEGRTARRAADRLAEAGGRTSEPAGTEPVPGTAGDLVPGDQVAIPQGDGTSKPVAVTESRPGPGGTQAVTVEDAYGIEEEEVLPASTPVHHLPDPPAPAAEPGEAKPASTPTAPRPRTGDVVTARAREAIDAVVQAAVDGVVPGTIHALRQSVAERLAPGAARGAERRAAADAAVALRRLGLDASTHGHAEQAVRHAAQKAREAAVRAVLRTLNDLEPLDGESEDETAERAVRLLRRVPEGIDPSHFALVAMARSYRATGGTPAVPAGAARSDSGQRARQRASRSLAAFTGRSVGAALGAAVAAVRRQRLDQQQVELIVQSAVRAMAEGQEAVAREIVDGVPEQQRPGLFSRVMAALVRLARRVAVWLRELLRKIATTWRGEDGKRLERVRERLLRRLRWWPEAQEIEADVAAAVDGAQEATGGTDLTPWLALLPTGQFGRVERAVSHWETASTADLEAGRLPQAAEERRWVADRAVDGGPGPEALRHLAAVRGAGEALDAAVTARMREAAPQLGADPHDRMQAVRHYAQSAVRRADRIAAEASAGSRDAGLELESALAEARQAQADEQRAQAAYAAALRDAARHALGQVRQMGPGNGGGLRADGEGTERLRGLEAFLPAEWLAAAAPVTVSIGARRGSYHPQTGHLSVGDSDATALHALAHHLQQSLPELAAAEEAYHWVRTSRGEVGSRERAPQVRLAEVFPGGGHHPRATARQGGWADLFTGSEPADGRSWEVLPTALEAMFSGSTWYLDDDLRQWLLGVMSTLGRRA